MFSVCNITFDEKVRIARVIARQIPKSSLIFINIGTTTEEVARALLERKGLRVITNNLNVATILSRNKDIEVIIAGGVVRSIDRGITGEATIDFIQQFKVDFGIIGVSGIDMNGTLLDFDYREVRVARAIIENSRKVFMATDHTKFSRNAMVRLGTVADIHGLFTDRQPPSGITKILEENGVDLFVTDES